MSLTNWLVADSQLPGIAELGPREAHGPLKVRASRLVPELDLRIFEAFNRGVAECCVVRALEENRPAPPGFSGPDLTLGPVDDVFFWTEYLSHMSARFSAFITEGTYIDVHRGWFHRPC